MSLMNRMRKRHAIVSLGVAWIAVLFYRRFAEPAAGAWDWTTLILLWALTAALAVLLILGSVSFVSGRAEARRRGDPLLTQALVKRFLIAAWVVALLYRVALNDVAASASFVVFWALTAALISFFIWQHFRRKPEEARPPRSGPPEPGVDR